MIVFYQVFISYTGGQSVSHVLLWQPSECSYLTVMILFCYFRKINMMMMIYHFKYGDFLCAQYCR